MPFLPIIGFMIILSLSTLLYETFPISREFLKQQVKLQTVTSVTLGLSNKVTKASNAFLAQLQSSLSADLDLIANTSNFSSIDKKLKEGVDFRSKLFEDYLNSIDPDLETNQGLSGLIAKAHTKANIQKASNTEQKLQLFHSNYLKSYTEDGDKKYASTLVSSEIDKEFIEHSNLASKLSLDKLYLTPNLAQDLLEDTQLAILESQQSLVGIELTSTGLSLNEIPNGIEFYNSNPTTIVAYNEV